jgi:Skp family chaperone for outer membrane proteins
MTRVPRIPTTDKEFPMKLVSFAALVAAAALPVAAQVNTPRVGERQANQEARIQQGVQSGQLTPKETAQLERGQAKVQAKEDKAKADGKVTARERAKLAKAQNKQSRKIARKKHNNKTTAPAT